MRAIEIGAFEAKTKFAELLEKVARGQEFLITKRGSLSPVWSDRNAACPPATGG